MEETELRECRFCDVLWSMIGIGIGVIFLGIGVDLLLQGRVSSTVNKLVEYEDEEPNDY